MSKDLQGKVKRFSDEHKARKKWLAIVASLCAVVAVVTSYVLINPATTKQAEVFCGYEEHVHDDSCYKVLSCDKEETEGHTHSEKCYGEPVLSCGMEETGGHTHSEKCYGEPVLSCGMEETEGHTHSEKCYGEPVLSCGMEETEGHTHSEACLNEDGELICGQTECEAHCHDDSCFTRELICGQTEREAHNHDDSCFTRELICGQTECEAHNHDDSCFTRELICGQMEREAHQHTDDCYKIDRDQPLCGKQEHIHTLRCFSNPRADLETESVWKETFSKVELTGKWDEDFLAIAKTQLGYIESPNNYEVQEDGTVKGITRYGQWYGVPYGDWCAMFCSFCLHYAGVDPALMPYDSLCQHWIETLSDEPYGYCHKPADYTPKPGDLIFFDWDDYKTADEDLLYSPEVDLEEEAEIKRIADHVGIVVQLVADEAGEPFLVRTLEGNYANNVQYCEYDYTDDHILCYAELPENPNYVPPKQELEKALIEEPEEEPEIEPNLMSLFPMVGLPSPTVKPIVPGSTSGLTVHASLVEGTHYEIADYFTVSVTDSLERGNIALQYSDNGMTWTNISTQQVNKDGNSFTDNGTVNGANLKNRQWRVYATKTDRGTTTEHIYGPFNIINLLGAADDGFDKWLTTVYVEQLGGLLPTTVDALYDIFDYCHYYKQVESANPGFTDWLRNEYIQYYGGDELPLTEEDLDAALGVYNARPQLTLTKNTAETEVTAEADPPQTEALYIWEYYDYQTEKWTVLNVLDPVTHEPVPTDENTISVEDHPEIAGKGIRCSMLDSEGNLLNRAKLDILNPDIDLSKISEINDLLNLSAYPVHTEGMTRYPNLSISLNTGMAFTDYFYYDAVAADADVPFSDAESYARYLVYVYESNGGDASAYNAVKSVWDRYLYDLYDPNYDMGGKNKGITTVTNYGDPNLEWPKDELSSYHATDGTAAHPARIDPLNYAYLENGVDYANFMHNLDKTATARNLPTASSARVYDVDISADCQAKVSSPVAMILQVQTSWQLFDFIPGSEHDHAEVLASDSRSTENDSAAMNISSLASLYNIKHALLRFVDYMEHTYPGNNLVLGVTEVQHGGSSSMINGTDSEGKTLYVSNNYASLREALLGWDIFGNCEHVHYDTNTLKAALSNLASNLSTWQDALGVKLQYDDIRKVGVIIGGTTENTTGTNGLGCVLPWGTFQSSKFNSVYGVQVSDGQARTTYNSWLNNPSNNGTAFADGTGSGFTLKYDALTEDQLYNTFIQIAEREMTAKGLDLKAEDKYIEHVTLYDTIQPEFSMSSTENIVAAVFNKDGTRYYETVLTPDYSSEGAPEYTATFNVYGSSVSSETLTVVHTTETDDDGKTVDVYTIKDVPVPYKYTVNGVVQEGVNTCDQILKVTENDDDSVAIVYDFGTVYNTKKTNLHLTLEAKEDYIGSNNVYTNVGTPDAEYTHSRDGGVPETYDIHTEKTPEVNVPIRFETNDGDSKTVLVGTEVDLNELDALHIVEDAVDLLDNYPQINGTMGFEWEMPDGTKQTVELTIPVVDGEPTGYDSMQELLAAVEEAIQKNFTPETEGTYKPRLNVTFTPDEMIDDGNFHNDTKTMKPVPERTEYGNVTIKALNGTQDITVTKVWAPKAPEGTYNVTYVVKRTDVSPVQYLYWKAPDNPDDPDAHGSWDFTDDITLAQRTLSAADGWTESLEDVPTVILNPDETVTILELSIEETSTIPDYNASYREGTIYDNFAEFTVDLSTTADMVKYLRIYYTVDGTAGEYTTTEKVTFNNNLNQRKASVTITLPDHYTSAPSIVITDAKVMNDNRTQIDANLSKKLSVTETQPSVRLTPDPTTGRPSQMIINTGPFDQPGEDPTPCEDDGITLNKTVAQYTAGSGNIENEFVVTLGVEVNTAEYSKSLLTAKKTDGTTDVTIQLGGTQPQGTKKATVQLKNSDGSYLFNGFIYWNGDNDINLYFGGAFIGTVKKDNSISASLFSQSFIEQFSANPTSYITGKKQDGTSDLEAFQIGSDPGGGCKKADLTILAPDGRQLFSSRIYFKPDNCSILVNGVKICELKDGNTDNKGQTVTLLSDAVFNNILDVVEDQMGEYVDYIYDGTYPKGDIDTTKDTPANMYDAETDTLTWHPAVRTDPVTGKLVAQLQYRIRLNTEKEGFKSCAANMKSAYGEDVSYDTNDHATLTLGSGAVQQFPKPYVRGILYNIEVKKTDDEGNPLAGAKFEITGSPNAVTRAVDGHYYVTTDASGMAKFEDLVALEEEYFTGKFVITEVEAPEGYMITEASRTVSISNYTHSAQQFVPDGNNMLYNPTEAIVFVDKIAPKLNLVKVSMENSSPLSGAEFELYKVKENDELELINAFISDDFGVIADNLSLDMGTYILEEIKAPGGYLLPSEQLKFAVTQDAKVVFSSGFYTQTDYDERSNTYYINVNNSSGYQLPKSGGIGLIPLYTFGVLMMTGALMYGCLRRRRERGAE